MPGAIANPRTVKGFAVALDKAKTDKLDAEVIARFAQSVNLQPQPVMVASAQELSDLMHRRQQLVEIQVAEKTRLSRASKTVQADIEAHLKQLEQRIAAQIARLVGVAPINHDSGNHKGKRMIAGGRTQVRCGLYMATLVATRHHPVIRNFYQRLLAQGKLKLVALVACMHKLLVILNAMIRDNKLWKDPVKSSR